MSRRRREQTAKTSSIATIAYPSLSFCSSSISHRDISRRRRVAGRYTGSSYVELKKKNSRVTLPPNLERFVWQQSEFTASANLSPSVYRGKEAREAEAAAAAAANAQTRSSDTFCILLFARGSRMPAPLAFLSQTNKKQSSNDDHTPVATFYFIQVWFPSPLPQPVVVDTTMNWCLSIIINSCHQFCGGAFTGNLINLISWSDLSAGRRYQNGAMRISRLRGLHLFPFLPFSCHKCQWRKHECLSID